MSCTDGAAALNGPALLDFTVNGVPARRPCSPDSNRSVYPLMAPHGIYRCKGEDRWIAIAVRNDDDWTAMCEVMGLTDLSADPRFANVEGESSITTRSIAASRKWTSARNPMEIMEAMQSRGVPSAAVQRPEDRTDHDLNTQSWGLYPEVEHPDMGRVRVDGSPIKLSETPAVIERGAPTLGQHNDEIFGELLGMGTEVVRDLSDRGVI